MKSTAFATASASLLAMFLASSPVVAADLGNKGDPTSSDYVAPISWTGFYLGGRIGYGNANHNLSVHDYFKDYCGDSGEAAQHGFDDGSYDIGNRAKYLSVDGVLTCDKNGPENTAANTHDNVVVGGDSREIASLDGLNSRGVTGGIQVGFDKQIGTRLVFGVFGSYDMSAMDTTATLGGIGIDLIEKGDEWSVGARFGFLLHPRVMAYALAAYTEADWEFISADVDGKNEVTFSGVTVGGGLEYALTQNVFLGIEGTHTFYGSETIADFYDADDNRGIRIEDEIGETKVLGTLKIKFGGNDVGLGF